MPSPLRLVTVLFLTVWSAGARGWQGGAPIVSSPTPAPIVKRGLTVQIRDLVRLPDTRGHAAAGSGRHAGRLGAHQFRARSS